MQLNTGRCRSTRSVGFPETYCSKVECTCMRTTAASAGRHDRPIGDLMRSEPGQSSTRPATQLRYRSNAGDMDSVRGRRRYNKTYGRAGPSHAHRSVHPVSAHLSISKLPASTTLSSVMITQTVYTRVIARTIDAHPRSTRNACMGTHSRPNTLRQKSAEDLLVQWYVHR
jgi:hypothetical protein